MQAKSLLSLARIEIHGTRIRMPGRLFTIIMEWIVKEV